VGRRVARPTQAGKHKATMASGWPAGNTVMSSTPKKAGWPERQ
jgi:hypothetical protein